MKKIILHRVTICMLLAGFFLTACEKEQEQKQEKLGFISDAVIKAVVCWKNLKTDTVYLINSTEEFQLISCTDSVPVIDFNTYSLIVARGYTTYGVQKLTEKLQQTSTNSYELEVDILLDMTAVAPPWYIAGLTPKLPHGTIITLNKIEHH